MTALSAGTLPWKTETLALSELPASAVDCQTNRQQSARKIIYIFKKKRRANARDYKLAEKNQLSSESPELKKSRLQSRNQKQKQYRFPVWALFSIPKLPGTIDAYQVRQPLALMGLSPKLSTKNIYF